MIWVGDEEMDDGFVLTCYCGEVMIVGDSKYSSGMPGLAARALLIAFLAAVTQLREDCTDSIASISVSEGITNAAQLTLIELIVKSADVLIIVSTRDSTLTNCRRDRLRSSVRRRRGGFSVVRTARPLLYSWSDG